MKQLKSIQAARGVAVTLVVLFHAYLVANKYLGGTHKPSEILVVGQTGVDLFFVISGFVMVLTTRSNHQSLAGIRLFLLRRFWRIFPPYWFYYLVVLVIFLAMPGMVNSSQGAGVDLLRSFFLLPSSTLHLLQVAWSLSLEVWFYAVFAMCLLLPRTLLAPALLLWGVMVLAANLVGFVPATPVVNVIFHASAIQFILGAIACLIYLRFGALNGLAFVIAGLFLFGLTFLLSPVGYRDVIATMVLKRALLFGTAFAAIILGVALLEKSNLMGVPRWLVQIGNWSYSIYLSHILVLSAFGRVYAKVIGSDANPVEKFAFIVAATFFCYLVGMLSYRLVERPIILFGQERLFRSRRTA